MSLACEPSSEPIHISAKQLFLMFESLTFETQVGVVGDGENAMEKFDDRVTVDRRDNGVSATIGSQVSLFIDR